MTIPGARPNESEKGVDMTELNDTTEIPILREVAKEAEEPETVYERLTRIKNDLRLFAIDALADQRIAIGACTAEALDRVNKLIYLLGDASVLLDEPWKDHVILGSAYHEAQALTGVRVPSPAPAAESVEPLPQKHVDDFPF